MMWIFELSKKLSQIWTNYMNYVIILRKVHYEVVLDSSSEIKTDFLSPESVEL